MQFRKYHALGNDYLIAKDPEFFNRLKASTIQAICDRNRGLGSDGILVADPERGRDKLTVRIFNPDGSEAEKSGNGLRIFARYLYDEGLVDDQPFHVETRGGRVLCHVLEDGKQVRVEMGRVSFFSTDIPVQGPKREVTNETIEVDGTTLTFCAATIGNPHCVVFGQPVMKETAMRYGPCLEHHHLFPNRTNVQFIEIKDRQTMRMEIWERGAGYTLASGSSSSAAAAVARKLGLVESEIKVMMPGGSLAIEIGDDYSITMTGAVVRVGEMTLCHELFADSFNSR